MNMAVIAPFQTASFRDVAEKCARVLRSLGHNVAMHDMNAMFFPFGKWDKLIYFNTFFLPSLVHLPRYLDLAHHVVLSFDSEGIPLNITQFFRAFIYQCTLVTPTEWCKRNYESVGFKVAKVIPRGFDPQELQVDEKQVKHFKEQFHGKKIILFVGALHQGMKHQRKGIEELLEAFKIVHKKHPETILLHYSNHHPSEVNVKVPKEIEHHYVCERNFGALNKSEVAVRYYACDVYVHPAHAEGFGMPLVEAMFCYKPPVYIAGGAMQEVCNGYGVGVRVSHIERFNFMNLIEQIFCMYDPKDLAEAILWCLENKELYEELGYHAHDYALERYNVWKVYREYEAV
ncbi:MAG: glycosyltransferase family 4 protein [Candidatus Nezhaarchaeales archaeon]